MGFFCRYLKTVGASDHQRSSKVLSRLTEEKNSLRFNYKSALFRLESFIETTQDMPPPMWETPSATRPYASLSECRKDGPSAITDQSIREAKFPSGSPVRPTFFDSDPSWTNRGHADMWLRSPIAALGLKYAFLPECRDEQRLSTATSLAGHIVVFSEVTNPPESTYSNISWSKRIHMPCHF